MYCPKDGWSFTFDLDGVEINGKILNEIIEYKNPNNRAPKSIKGDYDLSIHGNRIVLVDNKDGTTVEAKCHHDDEFDIGVGIKEAFKKLNEERKKNDKIIRVGDRVRVINSKACYPIYCDFFIENDLPQYSKYFRYTCLPECGVIGEVVYIQDNHYVVKCKEKFPPYGYKDSVYIMGRYGIEKVGG